MTSLPQQMKENKAKFNDFMLGSFHGGLQMPRTPTERDNCLDEISTSTWHNAQEEMLERAMAKIKSMKMYHHPDNFQRGCVDCVVQNGWNIGLEDTLAALSSLRAGESTKV